MSRLKTRLVRNDADLQQFFDETARDYRDQHGRPEKLLAYRLSVIQSLLGETGGQSLLEIGCGTGIHLFALAEHFARLFGTDLSPRMIEEAKSHPLAWENPDKITLQVDCAERLSTVPDESIDVVLCVGAFEHMRDKAGVLMQVRRVLKPGGCFVCLTPNGDYVWYRYWAPLLGLDTRHLSTDRFVSLASIREALLDSGLDPHESGYWTFIPRGDVGPLVSAVLALLDRIGRWLGLASYRGGLYFKAVKRTSRTV